MRKLYILRAILDYLWIISMILIPFVLIAIPGIFFIEAVNIDFKINGNNVKIVDLSTKIIFVIYALSYLLFVYIIFLFKKVIREFLRANIFSNIVVKNLNIIGKILIVTAIILVLTTFLHRLYFESTVKIDLGIGNNIIMFCLGLFFMILSEVFKISKGFKEENDLTI